MTRARGDDLQQAVTASHRLGPRHLHRPAGHGSGSPLGGLIPRRLLLPGLDIPKAPPDVKLDMMKTALFVRGL